MTRTILYILAVLTLMVSSGAPASKVETVYRACVSACGASLTCQASCADAAGR
jgi:hypothetical protein